MDIALLKKAAQHPKKGSHRILVLLAAVTNQVTNDLLGLTIREALLLIGPGTATPHAKFIRKSILEWKEDKKLSMDSLLFASQKRLGELKPIGRIQAWRVLHQALASIGYTGSITRLRLLFIIFALPLLESLDLEELLGSLPNQEVRAPSEGSPRGPPPG